MHIPPGRNTKAVSSCDSGSGTTVEEQSTLVAWTLYSSSAPGPTICSSRRHQAQRSAVLHGCPTHQMRGVRSHIRASGSTTWRSRTPSVAEGWKPVPRSIHNWHRHCASSRTSRKPSHGMHTKHKATEQKPFLVVRDGSYT